MVRKAHVAALLLGLGAASAADAAVINVSVDAADWQRVPYFPMWQTPASTVVNTLDGNLRGTKTTATPGSNWFLGIHTVDSYDLQNATLRYRWLINGQGTYSGTYNGVDRAEGYIVYLQDPNAPYAGHMTTGWSYAGSEILPSNTWLWTEFVFNETGYDFAISQTGYGGTDFLHGTRAITAATWSLLTDARPFMQIGDNYAAGAYFELAEMSITVADQPPPNGAPEPGTLALFGLGLAGIGAVRRRKLAA